MNNIIPKSQKRFLLMHVCSMYQRSVISPEDRTRMANCIVSGDATALWKECCKYDMDTSAVAMLDVLSAMN